jgi:hypothetical protein
VKKVLIILLAVFTITGVWAQDFGFGFDDDAGETASANTPISAKISGEVSAQLLGFVHDFSSEEKAKSASLGDMVSGALNFSASGANVDAFIGLDLSAASLSELATGIDSPSSTPLILNEAYLRSYLGPVTIEAGYRKLIWGRADSFGPLDVINPVDYTDLTVIDDVQSIKIARPLVHLTWNTGSFSKIEGVFIPNFAGHRFDQKDRWIPAQYSTMRTVIENEIYKQLTPMMEQIPSQNIPIVREMFSQISGNFSTFSPDLPNMTKLEHFQTGIRFTTTIGPADFGLQYFYGNLFQPDLTITGVDDFISDLVEKNMPILGSTSVNLDDIYPGDISKISPQIKYNRYHQIGVDYAQVLFGFNVRAEFAVHLTEDLKGDNGSVRNPFLGWSFGFDRDLFWGINANIQCNETIRLFNDKVGKNPLLDCEADADMTSTRITMQLSKRFLRDELETKVAAIWDVENEDCYIIPAIVWNIKDCTAELSAGILTGNEKGGLGQYWENSFVKLALSYSF